MRKIDHVRKTVYIIVGILTIISLVFTLCKKIGLCASSGGSNVLSSPPFPIGQYQGFETTSPDVFFNDDCINYMFNALQNTGAFGVSSQYYSLVTITEPVTISGNDGFDVRIWFNNADFRHDPEFEPIGSISSGSFKYRLSGTFANCAVTYNSSNDSFNFYYYSFSNFDYMDLILPVSMQPNNNYGVVVYDDFIPNYPVWSRSNADLFDTNGDIAFSVSSQPPIFNGHTKGGVLSNYIDSEDLLEDSSDLPKVDVAPPADPSSNAGWFQKILNGIGRLNQSVQGGVLTIGDYIGAGIEKLEEKLGEVKDSITGLYGWFTEDFDKNQFQNGINSIPLISDLNGLKTLVENSGMFNWSDVTPAQSVSFTFDFGGAVLPHSTNTIDFSWYTGNVKTICNAILCTFLVLGLFVTVVNQIPSIIGGHSGDKGGGSDS